MRPQRNKPALERIQESLANLKRAIDKKTNRAGRRALESTADAFEALDRIPVKTLRAIQRAYQSLISHNIDDADLYRGSTPYHKRLKTNFRAAEVNNVLKQLGHKTYDAKDAANFFDTKTDYWKMTENYYLLSENLKHFGIDNNCHEDEKVINSLAHKQLVRKHLKATISKALPKNEDDKNQTLAFQAFAFKNAGVLVGTGESDKQKAFYKSLIKTAANKKNILPLVFISELAGINFKEMFKSDAEFNSFVAKLADKQITGYLKNQDLQKAFS